MALREKNISTVVLVRYIRMSIILCLATWLLYIISLTGIFRVIVMSVRRSCRAHSVYLYNGYPLIPYIYAKRNGMEFGDDVVSYVIIMSLVLFCTHRVVGCNLKTSAVLAAIKPKNFSSNVHFFFYYY